MSVYIIAEAGVNHNGSIDIAKKLVKAAKQAGADCVKFQTYITENLVTTTAKKADYQIHNTQNEDTQYSMLKKLELSFDEFRELKRYCGEMNIDFISTPFDLDSIDFLESLEMKFWKIPSGEITNFPYLKKIANTKLPVILSTGMSSIEEVSSAVDVLKKNGCPDISILHCTTEYPTPVEECNLNAVRTLKEVYGVRVGYSDHTDSILIPAAAVAVGAEIIEKHFTLDKSMEGPDHKASLGPKQLKEMVRNIRVIECALGDGVKRPSQSEIPNIAIARKSIVAKERICKGEVFTEENLAVKRPGTGINPMNWEYVIGKIATKDFEKDELIKI